MQEDRIRLLIYVAWGLLALSLFVNLGLQPLRMEEPRRALVALEMDLQDNLAVPTLYGEHYYNKPPVWNWVLVGSAKLFGSYSEFAIRFFAIISLLLLGLVVYWGGKTYVSSIFGHASALLFLVGIEVYLLASQLGEIDLFYSLITFSQIFLIFHLYQRKKFILLFLFSYLLAGIGLLTKGLPSLAFQGITLLTLFISTKEWKRLISFPHALGLTACTILIFGYLAFYQTYNSPDGFIDRIWTETRDRTLLAKGIQEFVVDLFLFPVETLGSLLPASLLLPFVIRKDFKEKIQENPYILFCFLAFLANVLVYWLSPGTRQRYVYPLYPLLVNVMVYFAMVHGHELPRTRKAINILLGIVIGLVPLLSLALPFIPDLAFMNTPWVLAGIGTGIGLGMLILFIRVPATRWLSLVLVLILVRTLYSFSVFPLRSLPEGDTQREKDYAIYLNNLAGGGPITLLEGVQLPYRMGFYLSREMEEVVSYTPDSSATGYIIAYPSQVDSLPHEEITEFFDKEDNRYLLIKVDR